MKSFLCRHFENLLGLVLVASHRSYTLLPSRGNFENNTLVYVINFFLLSGGHLGHNTIVHVMKLFLLLSHVHLKNKHPREYRYQVFLCCHLV